MMHPIPRAPAGVLMLAGVLLSIAAEAQEAATPVSPALRRQAADDRGVYSLSFENDIFSGQDNNYTNGVRFSYFSPESAVPGWLEHAANRMPFFAREGKKRWGIAFGQSIFTPDNIEITTPQPNDQPYAGFLYGTAGVISDTGATLDTFQVTLGMVGPASGAEQTQKFVHSAIDSPYPNGWRYQLHNEPGIILTYERKWRNLLEFTPFGWGFDLTPTAGFNLGNIYTDATLGAIARFGYDLPADYGPPLIRPSMSGSDFFTPSGDFGWYLFAGLEGKAVARNIFLDGNTFRDSPSVDTYPLVGGVQAGIAFTVRDTRIAYTHVIRSDQFHGQKEREEFGSLNVSFRF